MRHTSETCTNQVCCRNCFCSGHVKKNCTGKPPDLSVWVPKVPSPGFRKRDRKEDFLSSPVSPVSRGQTTSEKPPSSASPPPQSPPIRPASHTQASSSSGPAPTPQPPMAVYAIDPH